MPKHSTAVLPPQVPIAPETTLADLASGWAGASRVFQTHGLDFCCKGRQTLAAACAAKALPVDAVLAELRRAVEPVPDASRWEARSSADLLAHILDHYHAGHRVEVPRLAAMAKKVEAVHQDHPQCPQGLAAHLRFLGDELELHMQKEEQVLFPWLLRGVGIDVRAPIACMLAEHEDHGRNLDRLRQLGRDYQVPADACPTWRALYLGLAALEREVMEHVHLENHVLFPRFTGS